MSSFTGVANLHTMSVSFPVSVGMHQFGLKYRRKARPLLNKMPPLHNLSFMALKQPTYKRFIQFWFMNLFIWMGVPQDFREMYNIALTFDST